MVLPRVALLVGRMIVNKWMIVAFIIAFVILEVQILQTSIPNRQNGRNCLRVAFNMSVLILKVISIFLTGLVSFSL